MLYPTNRLDTSNPIASISFFLRIIVKLFINMW